LGNGGFRRFSELASLKRSDISFFPSYVKLYLENSKTDVYREGRKVAISKTGTITCPVDMLDRYPKLADTSENSVDFIFRSVSFCKSTDSYKLRKFWSDFLYKGQRHCVFSIRSCRLRQNKVWSP
jgi:hypothetical protein